MSKRRSLAAKLNLYYLEWISEYQALTLAQISQAFYTDNFSLNGNPQKAHSGIFVALFPDGLCSESINGVPISTWTKHSLYEHQLSTQA